MIVIDASTLAKYLLKEEGWLSVEEYLLEGVRSVDLVVKEVANAIWKHVVVHKMVSIDIGLELYKQLKKLVEENVIVLESQEKYLDKAVEIALNYGVTIYDSLYIAQALRYEELLTSDKRQAGIARKLGVKVHRI